MSSVVLQCGDMITIHGPMTSSAQYFAQEIQLPANCPSATKILAKLIFDGPIPSTQSMVISSAALSDDDVLDEDRLRSCTEIGESREDVICPQGIADGGTGLQFLMDVPALQGSSQFFTFLTNGVQMGSASFGAFHGEFSGYHQGSLTLLSQETMFDLMDMSHMWNSYLICEMSGATSDDCEMSLSYGPLGGDMITETEVSGDEWKSDAPLAGGSMYRLEARNTGISLCEATCHLEPKTFRKAPGIMGVKRGMGPMAPRARVTGPRPSLSLSTMSIELPCGDMSMFAPGSGWTEPNFFQQEFQISASCMTAKTLMFTTEFMGAVPSGGETSLVLSNTALTADDIVNEDGTINSCIDIKVTYPDVMCAEGTSDGMNHVQWMMDTTTMPWSAHRFVTMLQNPPLIGSMGGGVFDGQIMDEFEERVPITLNMGQSAHFMMDMTAPEDCKMMSLFCDISEQTKDLCVMQGTWDGMNHEVKGEDFESEDPIEGCESYTVSFHNIGEGACDFECYYAPAELRQIMTTNEIAMEMEIVTVTTNSNPCGLAMYQMDQMVVRIGVLLMMLGMIKMMCRCCGSICASDEIEEDQEDELKNGEDAYKEMTEQL